MKIEKINIRKEEESILNKISIEQAEFLMESSVVAIIKSLIVDVHNIDIMRHLQKSVNDRVNYLEHSLEDNIE